MDFNKLAKDVLEPLLKNHGFTLKSESKGFLEYDHKILTISISYDYKISFEVDMTIHFQNSNESYSYSEMKEYLFNEKDNFIATQIVNKDKMKSWIDDVSSFLKENLKELVDHHINISSELNELHRQKIRDYAKENEEKFLKENVEKLWRDKNYNGLVEFLKKYEGIIESSIKKKYEYALKRTTQK